MSTNPLLNGHYLRKIYTKHMDKLAKKHELTKTELDILLFLHNHPDFNTASDIVELRMLAKSHVSTSIDELSAKGYINKVPQQNDRRKHQLTLKPSTSSIIKEAIDHQKELLSLLTEDFSEEEKIIGKRLLNKFTHNIEKTLEKIEATD